MIEHLSDIGLQKKYHNLNFISKRLVGNFFQTLYDLVPEHCTNVLDAGCGEGINLKVIHPKLTNAYLYGLDIVPDRIEQAKKLNPNAHIKIGDIYNIDYTDNYFELVLCNEVLEHLDYPESALKELYRVSNKYVVLSVPREPLWRILNMVRGKYWSGLGNTPNHVNNWSVKKFKQFVSPSFTIISESYPWPWQFYLLKK